MSSFFNRTHFASKSSHLQMELTSSLRELKQSETTNKLKKLVNKLADQGDSFFSEKTEARFKKIEELAEQVGDKKHFHTKLLSLVTISAVVYQQSHSGESSLTTSLCKKSFKELFQKLSPDQKSLLIKDLQIRLGEDFIELISGPDPLIDISDLDSAKRMNILKELISHSASSAITSIKRFPFREGEAQVAYKEVLEEGFAIEASDIDGVLIPWAVMCALEFTAEEKNTAIFKWLVKIIEELSIDDILDQPSILKFFEMTTFTKEQIVTLAATVQTKRMGITLLNKLGAGKILLPTERVEIITHALMSYESKRNPNSSLEALSLLEEIDWSAISRNKKESLLLALHHLIPKLEENGFYLDKYYLPIIELYKSVDIMSLSPLDLKEKALSTLLNIASSFKHSGMDLPGFFLDFVSRAKLPPQSELDILTKGMKVEGFMPFSLVSSLLGRGNWTPAIPARDSADPRSSDGLYDTDSSREVSDAQPLNRGDLEAESTKDSVTTTSESDRSVPAGIVVWTPSQIVNILKGNQLSLNYEFLDSLKIDTWPEQSKLELFNNILYLKRIPIVTED
jgi:hypothetical protein